MLNQNDFIRRFFQPSLLWFCILATPYGISFKTILACNSNVIKSEIRENLKDEISTQTECKSIINNASKAECYVASGTQLQGTGQAIEMARILLWCTWRRLVENVCFVILHSVWNTFYKEFFFSKSYQAISVFCLQRHIKLNFKILNFF